jgi:hypothetical protein
MQITPFQPTKKLFNLLVAAAVMLSYLVPPIFAQTEGVLYTFTGAGDGAAPYGNLVSDGSGNFYGVTAIGGSFTGKCQFSGCGNVFKLSPNSTGGWTQTVLYNFNGGADGANPEAGLTMDASGNLYGTAVDGGYFGNSNCGLVISGCGVVFKLSPNGDGTWSESVLYTFRGGHDGFLPQTTVEFDPNGNLYGAANLGGAHFVGTVYELSPNGSGGWSFKVLYSFANGLDGGRPYGFALDARENLFASTTQAGITGGACGSNGCGTILELSPNGTGGWIRHIVHDFTGKQDGSIPAGLSVDASGNLFGAALFGGHTTCAISTIPGCGVIFEFTPSNGHWQGHTVYAFTGGNDGATPYAAPTFDSAGNAYATSDPPAINGCPSNCGAVIELSPTSGGWTETTLYTFTGSPDGDGPYNNGITLDASGHLLGTTQQGGIVGGCNAAGMSGCGVIYEITP